MESSVGDEKKLKLTFRSGIFDGNSAAPEFGASSVGAPASPAYNKYGIDFHLNPSTGLIILNELAFNFLGLQPGVPPPGAGRWFIGPGHVLIGGFYATNRFENIYCLQRNSTVNAANKDMRGSSQFLLLLFATLQLVHAQATPRVDLPASYTLEVLNPKVILKGSAAAISGSVQPSTPWAETDWGHLEVALFDDHGGLIKRVAIDYFPRPVPHRFHSAYQPRSYFSVTINPHIS